MISMDRQEIPSLDLRLITQPEGGEEHGPEAEEPGDDGGEGQASLKPRQGLRETGSLPEGDKNSDPHAGDRSQEERGVEGVADVVVLLLEDGGRDVGRGTGD